MCSLKSYSNFENPINSVFEEISYKARSYKRFQLQENFYVEEVRLKRSQTIASTFKIQEAQNSSAPISA